MSTLELTPEVFSYLATLNGPARAKAYTEIGKAEWDKCADDFFYWIDATRHVIPYAYTQDPKQLYSCRICKDGIPYFFDKRHQHLQMRHNQDPEGLSEVEVQSQFEELPTTRPFTLFPYIEPIARAWLREKIFFIEKSRDMMATWTIVAMYTWDTIYHRNRENIFQSDDSSKTLDLVQRADFIWKNQPAFLRDVHPATFTSGQTRAGILRVPSLSSTILGFPQGPDQIRQYHPSGIFVDEAAFQVEAEAGFMAVKPAIQAGGRYTAVSSANPGFFMAACRDLQL